MADPLTVDGADEDEILSKSEFLSREEVLRRRSRRVKQLAKLYRMHYWALMEELKNKHKEYYWKYGKSPFKKDDIKHTDCGASQRTDEDGGKLGFASVTQCASANCKKKAMPLSGFCHSHILADSKQVLYKGCNYPVKSGQICGMPVLRCINPPQCATHSQLAERYLVRALRRAGLNVSSSSKVAPKLHIVVADYVRQIQAKRRAAQGVSETKIVVKEEKTN
ncbi:hypothetical protein SLEP1_g37056 [Rubroshorea leprosula]|uniref:KANL2-like probable zinc-finger domain-containing protein n=1 Tax=Rubroshorea leprosula TaxID=152421 RepID=A0AAV5KTJ3_9ROSI|nr:hypothetical protein SLEP1_g37056 [Rubroshorea leprosula]